MTNKSVLLTVGIRENGDETHLYLKMIDLTAKGTRKWLSFLDPEGASKRVLVSFSKERGTVTVEIGKGIGREKRTFIEKKNVFEISKQFSNCYVNAFTKY